MTDVATLTIEQVQAGLATRQFSAVELAQSALQFAQAENPKTNAYLYFSPERALAAAVAQGTAVVALGSDTGGSVRQPASFCGVVGVTPTYGRVSRYGLVAFASSLDHIGPMARTVGDAALLLQTIAGRDENDSTSAFAPLPDYVAALDGKIQGLKIGLPREYFEGLASETGDLIAKGVELLKKLGCEFREISLPATKYAVA